MDIIIINTYSSTEYLTSKSINKIDKLDNDIILRICSILSYESILEIGQIVKRSC